MILRGRWGRFVRYGASSAAATAASAGAFAIAYQLSHLGPGLSSVAAFLAGAAINFVGNRYWAWARRQRARLGRDVLGYLLLAVGTAVAAALVTSLADSWTDRLGLSGDRRTVLVEGAYFATYAAMFLVKFVVLDRLLFAERSRHQVESTTRA
ncbi:MAG TPA: GtrA family protein [Rugosimonospora sp.]|nr:GtrA family protein [Rugosimonospora sp.]